MPGYPTGALPSGSCDGWSAQEVFSGRQGLGLDELVFLPGSFYEKSPDLGSRLTKNLKLHTPALCMGGCEEGMAMALALCGGLGIIHRHMPIELQAKKLQRVKTYTSGFILNPGCLAPRHTVERAQKLQKHHGCSGIPLTENGRVGGKFLGLVTKRDLEGMPSTAQLSTVMNRDVVCVQEPVTLKEAQQTMQENKVSKLPVLNKDQELVAFICRGDMKQVLQHPNASRDANRQLMVGAAIGADEVNAMERVKAVVEAGAEVLYLEVEGVAKEGVTLLKQIKEAHESMDVICGPVSCARQASMFCEQGADGIVVGGTQHAEATVLYEVSRHMRNNWGVPVIADMQVKNSGEILKALLLGASTVCLDAMVQRCEEVPGDLIYREGVRVKLQTGYEKVPVEMGLATTRIDRGSILSYVPVVLSQLRRGLQDLGINALSETSKALDFGTLRMERQCPPRTQEAPKLYPIMVNALHCR